MGVLVLLPRLDVIRVHFLLLFFIVFIDHFLDPFLHAGNLLLALQLTQDINFIPEKFLVLREGCEVHFLVLVQLLVGNFLLLDEVIEFLHLLVGIELVVYVLRVAEKLRLLLLQRRAGIRLQVRLPNQHIWLRS